MIIKANPNKVLETFVNINILRVRVKGWVKREQEIWQFGQQSQQNLAEFYSLVEYGRVQQKQQIAVDYGKLRSCSSSGSDPGRTWHDLVDLVEYSRSGRLPQIAANCGLILSLYLLSWWKQVDVYKVLQVCFIISY